MHRKSSRSPQLARLALSISPKTSARHRHVIEEGLYAFNVQATGIDDGRELSILLRDARRRLCGGLLGHTWGGLLTVTALWVHPRHRGRGHGTRLLAAAETEGRKRRCKASVLATHSFQARSFYERFGYRVVAELSDTPYGHSQYWMRKLLTSRRPRKV
jgi:ribosomal protein S18 acetylase RimI-like enzyme